MQTASSISTSTSRRGLGYVKALDGVRAIAVLGVLAFHGGVPGFGGGFLGVDIFFGLSGFLICSLLLTEWQRHGTIRLGSFWGSRARRLLPALLCVCGFVMIYALVVVPGAYPDLRGDVLSALFLVSNWHLIFSGAGYFAQVGPPSPLTHTWSLAVEEQFYIVFPLIALLVLKVTRSIRLLLGVCVSGAVASAIWMAVLYSRHVSTARLYYGTDTHAQSILIGCALACGLALFASKRRATAPAAHAIDGDPAWEAKSGGAKRALGLLGFTGLAVLGILFVEANGNAGFIYQGGFLLAGLATAGVLICTLCAQRSLIARLLSLPPLRFIGRISYGLYLWHYPLFLWLNAARTGVGGYELFGLRLVASVAVATASFYLVERPLRNGTLLRGWRVCVAAPAGILATVGVLLAVTVAPVAATALPGHPTTTGPAVQAASPTIRVAVEGDSTAMTLGLGLSVDAKQFGVDEQDDGILGCGVVNGPLVQLQGANDQTNTVCAGGPGHSVPEAWSPGLATFKPNVVLILAGRWETVNREYEGEWTNILNPGFAAYVKSQLQQAVNVATTGGARVIFLTAPCYSEPEVPNGSQYPEDSSARLAEYNKLVREVVAANPAKASLINLNAMVCPEGQFESSIGGVTVRTPDGVHFTVAGGELLGQSIWPTVVRVGKAQLASSAPKADALLDAG